MSDADFDIAELRGWIGREDSAEELLTQAFAERFHNSLELPGSSPKNGQPAPRLIHFGLCQPAAVTSLLGADGHILRGHFLPPVPLPRRMWAASELSFYGDLNVGQTVRRQSRIADVTLKAGKTGRLCFVTVDHRIEADGVIRVKDRQTIVYRESQGTAGNPAAEAAPAPDGVRQRSLTVTPGLLFRYSALTFNSHRIHYDRPYAVEEEGYPGLVVHGPLQATWLLHFASEVSGGAPPDYFSFRGMSPLFDHDEIHLIAGPRGGNRRDLWTARPGGPVAMQAKAIWS
jgi:3-methylfumaryl-CoA hydratase